MWPCDSARKHFSSAIDGEPPSGVTGLWVSMHRTICPFCRRFESSLKHTMELGHALKDLPLEDDEPGGNAPKPDATTQPP